MRTIIKLFRSFYLFLLVLIFNTCTVITDTPGFYSGYSKLSEESRNHIVITDENILCEDIEFSDKNQLMAVTGFQLKDCLEESSNAIVYLWSPNCHSSECLPISILQHQIVKNGYDLFIVAEYLSEEIFSQISTENKVFWPNVKYYNTDYCNKYIKLFLSDLIGNDETPIQNKYLMFHDGVFWGNFSHDDCFTRLKEAHEND